MSLIKTSTSFDGLHTVEFNEANHSYKLDGKRVCGATTVGAVYPKGEGLIRWLIKEGIQAYDEKKKLTAAAAIGKVVHKYAESYMTGQQFDWDIVDSEPDAEIIRGCINQFDQEVIAKFPDDKLYMAEALVASPTLKVASMIDLVLIRDSEVIIRDYKTGKKIYLSALHQTVLYRRMLREWHNINCEKLEIMKFSKEPDTVPFESCIVDNDGITINGSRIPYAGMLEELEAQTVRNVETYRHTNSVERLITKYYEEK